MDNALETSSQRIRNHLRRPIPERCELLNENARNTVNEIVPRNSQTESKRLSRHPFTSMQPTNFCPVLQSDHSPIVHEGSKFNPRYGVSIQTTLTLKVVRVRIVDVERCVRYVTRARKVRPVVTLVKNYGIF
jgi:hypothetical protein